MKGLGVIAASGLVIAAAAAPLAVAAAPTAGESRNDISVNVANGERQVYFGWYDVATNESLSATASASNLYQAADVPAAVHAASLNQTSLLEVRWTFFGAAPGLKPDYQANWDTLAAQVKPLVESGVILGFNLGDELVWNCFDPAAVRTAADTVRATFPEGSAIIWYNEAGMIGNNPMKNSCGDVIENFTIPESLDWFSVDLYHMDGPVDGWVNDHVVSFYEENIFPNLTASQKVLLVPGSFGSDVNHYPNGTEICNRTCYDVMCAKDAEDFHQWALNDERVAAIMPWNWGGCASCNGSRFTPPHTCCMDEIGTVDQPLARAAWLRIGHELVHGGPNCTECGN